jgi:hypothetical protein
MARHSAALTSESDAPRPSRPSRSRGLNLVDERGLPVFEEKSSFGLVFALGAIILGVIFTALIVTGKIGQPSLQASEPPLPLTSELLQVSTDERRLAEGLERALVVSARLSAPIVTVTAVPASTVEPAPVPTQSPVIRALATGGASRSAPTANTEPASETGAEDNPY